MSVGVCVAGEIRSFSTSHVRSRVLDSIIGLENVSHVRFDLVSHTSCKNGLRLDVSEKLCQSQKNYDKTFNIKEIKADISKKLRLYSFFLQESSSCNEFSNSACCGTVSVPMGYFQYLRSDRCVRHMFMTHNVSHVIRLRPDTVCDTQKVSHDTFCIRHMAHYYDRQGDLLVGASRQLNPFSGALRKMESACLHNKSTPFPEYTLTCPTVHRHINCTILR